jgi:hypothetical protein
MYKSSPLTPIFKYVFPIGSLVIIIAGILKLNTPDDPNFATTYVIAGVWSMLLTHRLPFILKNITATEDGLEISEISKKILVSYKDIEWTTKFHFLSPWFVTIKYYDNKSGKHKLVSFAPNKKGGTGSSDDAMTHYINEKIATENPNYSKENVPSKTKNILLLIAAFIPTTALFIYMG